MPLRCLIVEDEVMIREMISDIAAVAGWTPRGCASSAELCGRLDTPPDVVFLDIGLKQSDAIDVLDVLATRSFPGIVQIVSGQSRAVIDQVMSAGRARRLVMAEPIAKPFVPAEIEAVLQGFTATRTAAATLYGRSLAAAQLQWSVWLDPATNRPRHLDCLLTELPAPGLLRQLLAKATATMANRAPDFLAASWSVTLSATLADVPNVLKANIASIPSLTCVFTEEDVFAQFDRSREAFAKLKIRQIRTRLDECGPLTFAQAGHRPLGIDELVVRGFLGGRARAGEAAGKMQAVAELAHRSGSQLMVADVPIWAPLPALAESGFDLVQIGSGHCRPAAILPRDFANDDGAWQRVPLTKLSTVNRLA